MKFAIDVLFVDGHGRTIRVVRNLAPWRIAIVPQAHAVIEMPAGSLADRDVRIGDEVRLVPPPALHLNVLRRPQFGRWNRANIRVSANTP